MKKDYSSLQIILRKIAEVNGKIFSESMMVETDDPDNEISNKANNIYNEHDNVEQKNDIQIQDNVVKSYNFYDLWRYKSLRKITISICLLSFVSSFCYYGSMFALPNLEGNFYWNAFFLALSEYMAYVVGSPVVRMFDRKKSLTITFLLTIFFSTLLIIYTIIDKSSNCVDEEGTCIGVYMQATMAILVKFVIAVGITVLYVYSNEIYPTAVRSLGLGATNFAQSFGSILASANEGLCNFLKISPVTSFVILSLISLHALRDVPETRGKPMEDIIEELKPDIKQINLGEIDQQNILKNEMNQE